MAVAIAHDLKLPIRFVGVGEGIDDLDPVLARTNTSRRCSRRSGRRALMRRALQLAARGRGRTSPNPMVGATIIAADGAIVGDGWHQQAGTPHAEIHAIANAGAPRAGRDAGVHARAVQPPRPDRALRRRIIAAGISRVVVAVEDPNPQVAGQGVARLRAHGIEVVCDVERAAASGLNAAFFMTMRRGPALGDREGRRQRRRTRGRGPGRADRHYLARRPRDARSACGQKWTRLAVGIETVLVDDPVLTAREVFRVRPLTRVVLDRRLRTPASARLLSTLDAGPVIIMTTAQALRCQRRRGPPPHARRAQVWSSPIGSVGGSAAGADRLGAASRSWWKAGRRCTRPSRKRV